MPGDDPEQESRTAEDRYDPVIGLVLLLLGAGVALHSYTAIEIGRISRMGPGNFPLALGVMVGAIGAILLVSGVRRPFILPSVNWRPMLAVTAAIVAFGILLPRFGIMPAAFLMTLVAILPGSQMRLLGVLAVCCLLAGLGAAMVLSLSLPIPLVDW